MKIKKTEGKLPLITIILEHKDQEYELDLEHVFKIVLLLTLIGLAYNLGAYVQSFNTETILNYCSNNINVNVTEVFGTP